MNLSEHFTLEELTHTDHREFDNTPDEAELANLVRLANFMEQVREVLGGREIHINSAFRSAEVNKAVGSNDRSQHRHGCACDFRVKDMTPNEVVTAIINSGLPYDQCIREFDRWTHISIPNVEDNEPRQMALIIDKQGTREFA
jgi:putative chitinase